MWMDSRIRAALEYEVYEVGEQITQDFLGNLRLFDFYSEMETTSCFEHRRERTISCFEHRRVTIWPKAEQNQNKLRIDKLSIFIEVKEYLEFSLGQILCQRQTCIKKYSLFQGVVLSQKRQIKIWKAVSGAQRWKITIPSKGFWTIKKKANRNLPEVSAEKKGHS